MKEKTNETQTINTNGLMTASEIIKNEAAKMAVKVPKIDEVEERVDTLENQILKKVRGHGTDLKNIRKKTASINDKINKLESNDEEINRTILNAFNHCDMQHHMIDGEIDEVKNELGEIRSIITTMFIIVGMDLLLLLGFIIYIYIIQFGV